MLILKLAFSHSFSPQQDAFNDNGISMGTQYPDVRGHHGRGYLLWVEIFFDVAPKKKSKLEAV